MIYIVNHYYVNHLIGFVALILLYSFYLSNGSKEAHKLIFIQIILGPNNIRAQRCRSVLVRNTGTILGMTKSNQKYGHWCLSSCSAIVSKKLLVHKSQVELFSQTHIHVLTYHMNYEEFFCPVYRDLKFGC